MRKKQCKNGQKELAGKPYSFTFFTFTPPPPPPHPTRNEMVGPESSQCFSPGQPEICLLNLPNKIICFILVNKDNYISSSSLDRFPFVRSGRSDQSVLKRNVLVSSQNCFWLEWPCSWIRAAQFSGSGRSQRGKLWREKCARALDLSI